MLYLAGDPVSGKRKPDYPACPARHGISSGRISGSQQEKPDPAQPSYFRVWYKMSELYKMTYIHEPAVMTIKLPMSQSLKENDCVPSKAILPIFCSCVQGVISLYGRVIELCALCPNWCCI